MDENPKTTPQPTNARQTKRLEKKCFYWLGHRQVASRLKTSNAENGTLRTRNRQWTSEDRPYYNRKLVYQVCGYTCHSAKNCNQRQKSASPKRQIPYEKLTQDETGNQRREKKGIMKHLPKIIQLTEDCGFDGQSKFEYKYEDDEPLN